MLDISYTPPETFEYEGLHGFRSHCGLGLLERDGYLLVILTELPKNPGTSVTNAVELIATQLRERDSRVRAYSTDKVFFVEHYLRDGKEPDTWDYVKLTWDTLRNKYVSPAWRDLENVLRSKSVPALANLQPLIS